MTTVDRRGLPANGCLPVAMLEDYLGRPLDQEKLLAGSVFVQCRHEAMLGFERDGVDPGIGGLLGMPFESELVPERVKGPLSRVSFDLPGSFFPVDLRVVAEHRD